MDGGNYDKRKLAQWGVVGAGILLVIAILVIAAFYMTSDNLVSEKNTYTGEYMPEYYHDGTMGYGPMYNPEYGPTTMYGHEELVSEKNEYVGEYPVNTMLWYYPGNFRKTYYDMQKSDRMTTMENKLGM